MENQTYKNDPQLHVPQSMTGTYTAAGQKWTISNTGITMPVNHKLYPNPVMPSAFLDAGGKTEEETGDGYYRFFGSAVFEYSGSRYSGECKIEIVAGDVLLLNGKEAVKE